jgi:hypothetical protein
VRPTAGLEDVEKRKFMILLNFSNRNKVNEREKTKRMRKGTPVRMAAP